MKEGLILSIMYIIHPGIIENSVTNGGSPFIILISERLEYKPNL